jgi:glycosyltransferase involved in cell wall biosynthesis
MPTSTPLISVIIPTYNYAQFISDAIRSVLNQSIIDKTEIIVIDDGSTDNTFQVIKPFLSCNIKYIHQNNSGLSSARNAGIQASKGRFIQFLDADDMLGEDALQGKLTTLISNPNSSIAICRTKYFRKRPALLNAPHFDGWPIYTKHLDVHLCNFNIAPPHAYLLRRSVIDRINSFDTHLTACEDYDFWLRALFDGCNLIFSPNGVVYYRRHKESMSQNFFRQRKFDAILHKKLQKHLINNKTYIYRREILMAFVSGVLCTCMRLHKLGISPSPDLIDLFYWAIKQIDNRSGNPFLAYFYFLQSMLTLKYYSNTSQDALKLKTLLLDATNEDDVKTNKLHYFDKIIKFVISSQDADRLERYRLAKYYLLTCI